MTRHQRVKSSNQNRFGNYGHISTHNYHENIEKDERKILTVSDLLI